MTEPFNVLVSSAGRRVALLDIVRRSLRTLGLDGAVLAADASPLSSAFHAADLGVRVPRCEANDFVSELLQTCCSHNVRLVIPTIDPELPVLADARTSFEAEGCTIAISGPETVAIGGDKLATHHWLEARRFPTVRQAKPAEVLEDRGGWELPVFVKPRAGSASLGARVVRDWEELAIASRDPELIVQELAPGDEYTVDVLVDRSGNGVCTVPRRRLEVRAGEVSKGVTVRDAVLEELARAVGEALPDAYGAVTVQIFLDRVERQPRVIEINPRFGGGFPLADRAGARFTQWIIEEVAGLPTGASQAAWDAGVVMLRYDDAVFVNDVQAGLAR
ncbi:MAG: ATP-grasp domain-containing protein [Acidimicrobiia bacterium]